MGNYVFLLDDACGGLLSLAKLVYNVIKILVIVIPIILIILGTIDLGKAVVASDDKEIKAAQSLLIKRIIYAAVIFFVPVLITVIMNMVSNSTDETSYKTSYEDGGVKKGWKECWNAVTNKDAAQQPTGGTSGGGDTTPSVNPNSGE